VILSGFIDIKKMAALAACLVMVLAGFHARAQKPPDSSNKITIQILNAQFLTVVQSGTAPVNKLIGEVRLQQGDNYMNCDSAYINTTDNNVEAFGNVNITQPGGTHVTSDYLKYTGNTRQAYLKGNVSLTDGSNQLWSEELQYDLGTKVGTYTQGGTLHSESTTLSSNTGVYNLKSKDARFKEEVFVTDPRYNVVSDDLGYNTESKVVRFFGPSVVTNDKSELRTKSGTWDSKREIAQFTSRSSMQNVEQYIEADKIDYNRKSGFGNATGHVIAIDTSQHTTLFCGYAEYNEISRKLFAYIKPVMKQMNGTDSLFIRADTFYSAPVPYPGDTMKIGVKRSGDTTKATRQEKKKRIPPPKAKSGKAKVGLSVLPGVAVDTVMNDTTRPRYFIGYHHVKVWSDSLQARCDSISYSEKDSVMRMMYDPVAWARNSQISGDTISLYMDSGKISKLYVPNNALIISQSGPEKAQMFDQVQGKTLTGHFVDNALTEVIVWPNAEAIYFAKDEAGAYLGANQAQSERMRIFFREQKIHRIIFEQEIKQTMTPMEKANIQAMRLGRFKWLADQRPASRAELFE
jgi:lipopolysaccharide export system protein LptA